MYRDKTTLPLTHVFKATLIIKTKTHGKLNKIFILKKKKTYPYPTVTYINNSIQNKTHPYVQNEKEGEKKKYIYIYIYI